ncbi:hypothetical protein Hoch_2428 [Haliangium ochraceum DSM 14365]|uniref:Uncharacterized protein n=1 Tax=Haliangium ochraceum (strain DSM 14365 / JCM 11303 / SMP-2) TaxID=502025 RepID=D0LJB8_HALO1|nr:hypothetical protein Hoch_2428 [Haliangium ochraceum DSM 14365]
MYHPLARDSSDERARNAPPLTFAGWSPLRAEFIQYDPAPPV